MYLVVQVNTQSRKRFAQTWRRAPFSEPGSAQAFCAKRRMESVSFRMQRFAVKITTINR
jgi:hypothetical protein